MAVVINIAAAEPSEHVEVTCVGDDRDGRRLGTAGTRIEVTSNQDFLAAVLGGQRRVRKRPFDWRSELSRDWGGYTTNKFPSHVSNVPFVWDYLGTRCDMAFAAGVTGVDFDDDTFLTPRLGFAVTESTSAARL